MNMWDLHYQRRHRHPPLFADELSPVAAHPKADPNQCWHGGDAAGPVRCTNRGRWRKPQRLWRRRANGEVENPWVGIAVRCDEHRLIDDELVEGEAP